MGVVLFWFGLAIAVGVLASNRGRSGFTWFLISVVISPLLGFIFVLVMENLSAKQVVLIQSDSPSKEVTLEGNYRGEPELSNDFSYKVLEYIRKGNLKNPDLNI